MDTDTGAEIVTQTTGPGTCALVFTNNGLTDDDPVQTVWTVWIHRQTCITGH